MKIRQNRPKKCISSPKKCIKNKPPVTTDGLDILLEDADEHTGSDSRTDDTCYVRSHSMHEQEIGRIFFLTDFLGDSCSHRNCRYTCRANERIDFSVSSPAHEFSEQNAAGRSETECDQTKCNDAECFRCKEKRTACGCTDSCA